jgi:hypothetical protein
MLPSTVSPSNSAPEPTSVRYAADCRAAISVVANPIVRSTRSVDASAFLIASSITLFFRLLTASSPALPSLLRMKSGAAPQSISAS